LGERGVDRLAWAIGRRVVVLDPDPYNPDIHRLLLETSPLSAGDLPMPVVPFVNWSGTIPLGLLGTTGEPFDLSVWSRDRGFASMLVAGTTGAGKSNSVNVILSGAIAGGVCVVGLDCKGGETLSSWNQMLGHPLVDPLLDPSSAEELLRRLVELMERRHRLPGTNYPPVLLAVEEWASLPVRPTSLGDLLERIAAQGRSASVGLLVTTQRPTANVGAVRTSTRGNLPIRIAHSMVGDRAASESVLGMGISDAADLPTNPPGLAIVREGGGDTRQVRVFRCPGPPWPESPRLVTLKDVEAGDAAVQRDLRLWAAIDRRRRVIQAANGQEAAD